MELLIVLQTGRHCNVSVKTMELNKRNRELRKYTRFNLKLQNCNLQCLNFGKNIFAGIYISKWINLYPVV